MTSENAIMRELHAIREKNYEETKHLTREEYVALIRERVEKRMAELGITLNYEPEPVKR